MNKSEAKKEAEKIVSKFLAVHKEEQIELMKKY